MAETLEKEPIAKAPDKEADYDNELLAPGRRSGRVLGIVVSLLALVVMSAATGYMWPRIRSAIPILNVVLPNPIKPPETFPRKTASVPVPAASVPVPAPAPILAAAAVVAPAPAVSAALEDIQSAQKQHSEALVAVLRRQTATLNQGTTTSESLKQGFAAQQTELKRISGQLASLAARLDSLQNDPPPLTTSSIPKPTDRARLVATSRKKTSAPPKLAGPPAMSRPVEPSALPKPVGPVSVGGAPLSPSPAPGSGAG